MVYQENPEHVPDPTAMSGTLDTSGTAGGEHEKIENVSSVFAAADAQNLTYAEEVGEGNITAPGVVVTDGGTGDTRDTEEAEQAVADAAENAREEAEAAGLPPIDRDALVEGAQADSDDATSVETAGDPDKTEAEIAAADNENAAPEATGSGADSAEKPAGNASTATWQEYAKSQGKTDEELDGKSRDEIKAMFA